MRLAGPPEEAIHIKNAKKITVALDAPAPFIDVALGDIMLLPAAVERCDIDLSAWAHPVGTGPFQLVEVTPAGTARLARNPAYWRRAEGHHSLPYLDAIEFVPMRSPDDALQAVASGALTIAPVPWHSNPRYPARAA